MVREKAIQQEENKIESLGSTESQDSTLSPASASGSHAFEHLILTFLESSSKIISEEIRFKHLRLLPRGLFIEESVIEKIELLLCDWHPLLPESKKMISTEKLKKYYRNSLSSVPKYLLDGKALLFGYELCLAKGTATFRDIPVFNGSLLETSSFIHMRDPILFNTPDITTEIGNAGLRMLVSSRKHPVKLDNTSLQQLALTLQRSQAIPKKYREIKQSLRQAVPAFREIWEQARVIRSKQSVLIPKELSDEKDAWYLSYKDLIFVQRKEGQLAKAYGLRGKNLHEFLVHELYALKNDKRRFKTGTLHLGSKTKGYGEVELEKTHYQIHPIFVRTFLLRLGFHRDITEKLPPRFTLGDALKQLIAIVESSIWIDARDVPRHYAEQQTPDTNYRAHGKWIFAINRKREILSLFDKTERTPKRRPQNHTSLKTSNKKKKHPKRRLHAAKPDN